MVKENIFSTFSLHFSEKYFLFLYFFFFSVLMVVEQPKVHMFVS